MIKLKLPASLLLLFCCVTITAQDISKTIDAKAVAIQTKLVEWRRHFHEHPELGNREFKTAAYIVEQLKDLGLEIQTGVGKTGVIAILKGGKPGPCIALRADIDALPVKEKVNIPFASKDSTDYNGQRVPVMHACGHDAHTAMLIGTARVLSTMKKDIAGTIKFIFQPAEEGPPTGEEGGAALMVKEGAMDNPKVDVIFGMHIESWIPAGDIQYKSGSFMASADKFTVKVKGKSSHGSQPWLGVDPIAVSANIIEAFQQIVSRQMDLTKAPVVITVAKFNSGVRFNIIPDEAMMEGTLRTLDSKMRTDVQERMKFTAAKIAEASNATVEVNFYEKTLVTYNTPSLVEKMVSSLQTAAGKENVRAMDWVTGAEDFSYFGTKAPAFFFYFGGMPRANDAKNAPPHHTSEFLIDDSQLYVGVKTFCQLVFDYPKTMK
ncbi:amidohydrolase [Ferruginibacter sp. SUN106]|uniref:amidohydrolase n=1 Tax=Ferruginibacter sp. SUN106 TaxID=2978348 RepID=UPI003D36AB9D